MTYSERPGNGKRPRVVLQVKLSEGGWDKKWLEMSTVELNSELKKGEFSAEKITELKSLRRRVKNRIYAQRSRARKADAAPTADNGAAAPPVVPPLYSQPPPAPAPPPPPQATAASR